MKCDERLPAAPIQSTHLSISSMDPSQLEDAWQAVVSRDKNAVGQFVYGVKSTGIYCRPDCSSKLPARKGASFFTLPQDAESAGFRACKRCHPQAISVMYRQQCATVAACRLLEDADTPLSLAAVSAHVNMSPWHFQRTFKNLLGVSPKQYAAALQQARAREGLQREKRITDAVYAAGFESMARFYARAQAMLGMAPSAFQAGGAGMEIDFAITESLLGPLLVAATETGVCSVRFGDSADSLSEELRSLFPNARLRSGDPEFMTTVEAVANLIVHPKPLEHIPLDIQGTAFQQRVWQVLRGIPAGKTMNYAQVAEAVGNPAAHRAVANACGANQLALLIPCHRVVRADGDSGGYRWGVERKQRLLLNEQ